MSKFVKFVSKADEWFKEGTEAFYQDDKGFTRRMPYPKYQEILNSGYPAAVFTGIRVCGDNPNESGLKYLPGDERIDGEWCNFDEFDIEIVNEDLEMYN